MSSSNRSLAGTGRLILIASVLILIVQAAVSAKIPTLHDSILGLPPVDQFPLDIGDWHRIQDGVVEDAVLENLAADMVLNRDYQDRKTNRVANFFVAYYRTIREALPHSPKACLPGSGWTPRISDTIQVTPAGGSEPAAVNRYVVAKGNDLAVVVYWYQSARRVFVNDAMVKIYRVSDAIQYRRSDTAMVRIVLPVYKERVEEATADATRMAAAALPALKAGFTGAAWE